MMETQDPESLDQFCCSVCLEVLKNPVTLPCGHNYCAECIQEYWDQCGVHSCPQCREYFPLRPALCKNTLLAEVLEKLKSEKVSNSQSDSDAGPGDVVCDVCPKRKKKKALASCFTCLVSYCEAHILPHRESEAFRAHKLEAPAGNLQERLCTEHKTEVQLYCRTDHTCVCLLCVAVKHKNHELVEPGMERAEKQNQMAVTQKRIKKQIQDKIHKVKKMKEAVLQLKSSAEIEVQECEKIFTSLIHSIERLRSEATALIRDHERREVRMNEELIDQLERDIEGLKRRDSELEQLSKMDDHIHFLQKFSSFHEQPEDGNPTETAIHQDLLPDTLSKNLSDLKKCLQKIMSWEFVNTVESEVTTPSNILQDEQLMSRSHFLQYSCEVTLDPSTAHRDLYLSEENRKVTWGSETQYPDHADRFDCWKQVLCKKSLTGRRWYWEVEWSGYSVVIGVSYKAISRKGLSLECVLGANDKSWSLCCNDSSYSVLHNNEETEIIAPHCSRIGVYLDYPAGSLSFYSISDTMTLLHRFTASFVEPLYPGFLVETDSSLTICRLHQSAQ